MSGRTQFEVKIHPGEYLELTKYSKKLEEAPELKSWILPNEKNPYTAKCKYCIGSTLRADKQILIKHALSKKHRRNTPLNVKCRTCLVNSNRDHIRSIFSVEETTSLTYADIVFVITGVKITLESGDLPSGMCLDCRTFSVKAYNFQMQVKRADALIHRGVKTEKSYDDYEMTADTGFLDYEQLEWEPESCSDNLKLENTEKCKSEQKSNQCCLCSDSFDSSIDLLKHVQTEHPNVIKCASIRTKGTVVPKKRKRILPVPATVLSSVTGSRANGLHPCSIPILGVLDLSKDGKKTAPLAYRCGVCSKVFQDETQLDDHCRGHVANDVLMCSLCEKVYFKYCHFKRHFSTHHPDLEAVNQIDNTETLLDLQDTTAVETILQYIRSTTIGDIIHSNVEPSEQPVEIEAYVQVCGLCGCVILSPEELVAHNQTEHPDFDTRCYYCARTYTDNMGLKHHKKICRTREKKYECIVCGMRFYIESALVKHLAVRHPQTFSRWIEYKKHSPRHVCKNCNQTFALNRQLKNHNCSCDQEQVYICDFCSKSFHKKLYLQRHINYMHDGNKNKHLCSACGKGFPILHQMIVHMRTHTRDFPYKCTLCPKEFATAHAFTYHKRWHTGDSPHVCKECGNRFIRAVSLRNHMLIHTGERPFPCDICSHAFRQQYDLMKHKAKIHGAYLKTSAVSTGTLCTESDPNDRNSSIGLKTATAEMGLTAPSPSKRVKAETGLIDASPSKRVKFETGLTAPSPSAAPTRASNSAGTGVYSHKDKYRKPTPNLRSLPIL